MAAGAGTRSACGSAAASGACGSVVAGGVTADRTCRPWRGRRAARTRASRRCRTRRAAPSPRPSSSPRVQIAVLEEQCLAYLDELRGASWFPADPSVDCMPPRVAGREFFCAHDKR